MKRFKFLLAALLLTGSAVSVSASTYSEAVNAGDFLYISGQFPIDPSTGKIVEGDMGTLTNVVLDHIQHLLHVNGLTMKQVVKTEVYLTDVRDFNAMDSAYATRFNFPFPPARDVVVVSNLLNNATIEISCIAYKLRH
ncbi:MAG: RidA family protein [Verrucomicrobia bacterium]|nr:RidA family protein [Verrucomicrobiota bacterium]